MPIVLLGVLDTEVDGVTEKVPVYDPEPDDDDEEEPEPDALPDGDADHVGEASTDGEAPREAVPDPLAVMLDVKEAVIDPEDDPDPLLLPVGVDEGDASFDREAVGEPDTDLEDDCVPVMLPVIDADPTGLLLPEGVREAVRGTTGHVPAEATRRTTPLSTQAARLVSHVPAVEGKVTDPLASPTVR